MQTTSASHLVTVNLDAGKQTLAVTGQRVSIELPSTRTVGGRIASVSKVAKATSASGGSGSSGSSGSSGGSGSTSASSTIAVTIALGADARLTALDQAPVTVSFAQQSLRNVEAVPVTALVATAGNGNAVEVVQGTARHLVRVTPGLYAGGYVQISGGDLAPGTVVTDAGT